eukprot:CAMPEP_0115884704 /NCGR_PEP_ID=MMETSP0287-20121206/30266_1 /TAXON_ID=412157 /ORGANISM="Chrysochromulina rotalis, Strain UIO044" /LENGTH=62 /DNA_ID=CAMNT_0003341039 /DNA_START=297 /DNA_END=482 /DNA_ORIENTATION=-
MHYVEPVLSGCRFAVPAFFETHKNALPWEADLADDTARADALWSLALWPEEAAGPQRLLREW